MCGRYHIDDGRDAVQQYLISDEAEQGPDQGRAGAGRDIFPTDPAPVVTMGAHSAPVILSMRWGYTLPDGRKIINARSETAAEKPLFRQSMQRYRCAVPATHYYEWRRVGRQRVKYAIRPVGSGHFYMAGCYRFEGQVPVFCILTRAVSPSIAMIHDRMPVILPSMALRDWVDPLCDPKEMLLHAVLSVTAIADTEFEQLSMGF